MTAALLSCVRCGALLAPWEQRGCACGGPERTANAELLYAAACAADGPIHVRDFVRLVGRDYGRILTVPTANATLALDPRFCWAGKGLYCLYRHGPLPGPRNLESVARLGLFAAGQPLTIDALDFALKRLGYRYNVASLGNAVSRSRHITWRRADGRWEHARDTRARRALRADVPTAPAQHHAAWQAMLNRFGDHIQLTLTERQTRLYDMGDPFRFGIDWSVGVHAPSGLPIVHTGRDEPAGALLH